MILEGAFVRANFPFGHPPEARFRPGPYAHIAYCLGVESERRRAVAIVLAYTSSGPWRGEAPNRPLGVIEFTTAEAAKLNQRAFHIDLRCLARVPPSPEWLPDWDKPGQGIVALADAVLRGRIAREADRLARSSPELVEVRGITSRRPERGG